MGSAERQDGLHAIHEQASVGARPNSALYKVDRLRDADMRQVTQLAVYRRDPDAMVILRTITGFLVARAGTKLSCISCEAMVEVAEPPHYQTLILVRPGIDASAAGVVGILGVCRDCDARHDRNQGKFMDAVSTAFTREFGYSGARVIELSEGGHA